MIAAPTWAIIPVKALGGAKLRLAPALPAPARRRLMRTMLEDVLATIGKTEAIARTIVVTPDAEAAELAARAGAMLLREDYPRNLNAAVALGLARAEAHGVAQALVLPADVPLAEPGELRAVIEALPATSGPRAALVPSHDGDGTNALLVSPPGAIEPAFGEGSFVRHLAQAVGRRLDTRVLHLPGLAADIDTPRDLARLEGMSRYDFLAEFLAAYGCGKRHGTGAQEQ
ncbi:MAG: 2-phospho-L-lactate guanylyltransferase [Hyphomicrobiaceae bacterium]|nr:MAG: 2-phospho-L-lactate guanylyltransferase [Hyphomicrobiaceae bacterium]